MPGVETWPRRQRCFDSDLLENFDRRARHAWSESLQSLSLLWSRPTMNANGNVHPEKFLSRRVAEIFEGDMEERLRGL